MDLRKVKKLIELLEESNLNELEISEGEESIRLSRGTQAVYQGPAMMQPLAMPEAAQAAAARPAGQPDAEPAAASTSTSTPTSTIPAGHQVSSPMVGTYFEAAEPDAAPFVSVGTRVEAGDTLCVVEAMKIFNQIEADVSGTVVHVQKGNGEAVEYGELLFVIQQSA